jgi:predicted PurR-regulated permease PerM
MKLDIIPVIKFFYSKKTYYRERRALRLELKDLIKRLLRFSLVLLAFFLILALSVLALIDIIEMLQVIYRIWNNYFQYITKVE